MGVVAESGHQGNSPGNLRPIFVMERESGRGTSKKKKKKEGR